MDHPVSFRVREDVTAIQLTDINVDRVATWCRGTVVGRRAPAVQLSFGGLATNGDWVIRDPKRLVHVGDEAAHFFVMTEDHFRERYTPGPAECVCSLA